MRVRDLTCLFFLICLRQPVLTFECQVSLGNMLSSELQVWHHLSVNSVTYYQIYTFYNQASGLDDHLY